MKSYIALFRGINVGGRNLLPMKKLTTLLATQGCQDIKTYIQSGNVIFSAASKPGDLSALVNRHFGFSPEVMVLEAKDFLAAVDANPFASGEGSKVYCYFCGRKPKPDVKRIEALKAASESYEIRGRQFYLLAPDGIGRSKLVADIDRCLGVPATGRNLNTLNKLKEMLQSG